jgi:hypothetical protein
VTGQTLRATPQPAVGTSISGWGGVCRKGLAGDRPKGTQDGSWQHIGRSGRQHAPEWLVGTLLRRPS